MKSLLLALLVSASVAAEPIPLSWPQLQPLAERGQGVVAINPHLGTPFVNERSPIEWQQQQGQVLAQWDGQAVQLRGFVVPLLGDGQRITEFLLVPYLGACVHVPPPATNQLVHVRYPAGLPFQLSSDPIVIRGTLYTRDYHMEQYSSGYALEADHAEALTAPLALTEPALPQRKTLAEASVAAQ
ncbi:DUF3299 domain-containing protein [uncultured Ferrimonas sp.]|uniref:DUF3299 domain-containing protein n=1 Tax=uncultured Ferrimonas sp. TaxID=432640 RepID=UPI00260E5A58|nr:DUF3299 domain-containing protein [uncultured Ferrimonas sp.]